MGEAQSKVEDHSKGEAQTKGDAQSKEKAQTKGVKEEIKACKGTSFTKKDLKKWHTTFRSQYPSGYVSKSEFKDLYCKTYVKSKDAHLYAQQVFRVLDIDNTNKINFGEFIQLLEMQSEGSLEDKLHWMFSVFDMNEDGSISKSEMLCIVRALYKMTGQMETAKETPDMQVNRIFKKADLNGDGKLSLKEFLKLKESEPTLMKMMVGKGQNAQ